MAKRNNRKKKADGFIFPVPFAMVVIFASTLALAYVWLGCRCEAVGREIKALEIENEELRRNYVNENYKWTRMKSPQNLESKLRAMNIAMDWPRKDQVVILPLRHPDPDRRIIGEDALVHISRDRRVRNE